MGVDHSQQTTHKASEKPWRLINRDGTFNVRKPRHISFRPRDLYHSMLAIRWRTFLALSTAVYLLVNFFFALLFYFSGADALGGVHDAGRVQRFLDCFFFSVQTFATIGYGKIVPESVLANVIVTAEALVGIFSAAVATGLVFARFARPTSRVIFSDFAVVNRYEGVDVLMFRIANERFNQIVEATIRVVLSISEVTKDGEWYRELYDLRLERASTPIFGLSWTVVHPINSESPLFDKTHHDLLRGEAELICSFMGIDNTLAQSINARFSYTPAEILWDHRFKDILSRDDGVLVVDIDGISEVEPLAKEASSLVRRHHRSFHEAPL
jgi:inward rectifier potassium channel